MKYTDIILYNKSLNHTPGKKFTVNIAETKIKGHFVNNDTVMLKIPNNIIDEVEYRLAMYLKVDSDMAISRPTQLDTPMGFVHKEKGLIIGAA